MILIIIKSKQMSEDISKQTESAQLSVILKKIYSRESAEEKLTAVTSSAIKRRTDKKINSVKTLIVTQ